MFPELIQALVRFAHGGLLQWRFSAATSLNIIAEVARIAADKSHGSPSIAAKLAAVYIEKCREDLFSWSRTHPETVATKTSFGQHVEGKFLQRDSTLFQEALAALKGDAGTDSQSTGRPAHCISKALSVCRNERCSFIADCAFCFGSKAECPSRQGNWMNYHLRTLRQPKIIANAADLKGYGKGKKADYARDRSRSGRDGRRAPIGQRSPRRNHSGQGVSDSSNGREAGHPARPLG